MGDVRPGRRFSTARGLLLAGVTLSLALGPSAGASAAGGRQLWVTRYNGPGNLGDRPSSVATSPDGSKVFVTGFSDEAHGNADYGTVAYDASTGARLWASRYNGPADNFDFARSIAVSPDGSMVFVTGSSVATQSFFDYATVAYDASTGAQLWLSRYDGPSSGYDAAYSVAVSPGGSTVFVTGWSEGINGDDDYATVAYTASTGTQLWVSRYQGLGNGGYDVAYSVAASPGGSAVFVTGWSEGTNGYNDFATVAYDASTGAQLWAKRYNGPGNGEDEGQSVGVSPGGSEVFVTGTSGGITSGQDYATVAYDASTGAQLWAKRYNGPGNADDGSSALAVSPGGSRLFVTGWSTGTAGYFNYATVAYSVSTGAQLWATRYDGPGSGDDVPSAVGVAPGGSKVFVTGWSTGTEGKYNFVTAAYSASSGALLWLNGYNGPGHGPDLAYSLVPSVDGKTVFVTGGSPGRNSGEDYATVAYSA